MVEEHPPMEAGECFGILSLVASWVLTFLNKVYFLLSFRNQLPSLEKVFLKCKRWCCNYKIKAMFNCVVVWGSWQPAGRIFPCLLENRLTDQRKDGHEKREKWEVFSLTC